MPNIVSEGATVVVPTRDGQATKRRFRSLSDTAIVLEGGRRRSRGYLAIDTQEESGIRQPAFSDGPCDEPDQVCPVEPGDNAFKASLNDIV